MLASKNPPATDSYREITLERLYQYIKARLEHDNRMLWVEGLGLSHQATDCGTGTSLELEKDKCG